MEEAFNITAPQGLCEECAEKLEINCNQEFFWVYCQHSCTLAVMEISEETDKPTGIWELYTPVFPVEEWIRNRKKFGR